jgi:hypothetical protein
MLTILGTPAGHRETAEGVHGTFMILGGGNVESVEQSRPRVLILEMDDSAEAEANNLGARTERRRDNCSSSCTRCQFCRRGGTAEFDSHHPDL